MRNITRLQALAQCHRKRLVQQLRPWSSCCVGDARIVRARVSLWREQLMESDYQQPMLCSKRMSRAPASPPVQITSFGRDVFFRALAKLERHAWRSWRPVQCMQLWNDPRTAGTISSSVLLYTVAHCLCQW